jgi:MFS superfamily sulfate permease-like transporter
MTSKAMTSKAIAAIPANLVAGLSVAGLLIPESVAYAAIAGLSPGRALVAAVAGGLAYALIGRSRFAVVAPTSSSAAILAAGLATMPGDDVMRAMMATAVVTIVGLLFGLIAVLRLGSLAGFVARPVLRGFAFGLAMTIVIRQLPTLFGIEAKAPNVFALLGVLAARISTTNIVCLGIGTAALAVLLLMRRTQKLPGALIVLAGGVGLSFLVDLPGHGVALVGPITFALDRLTVPQLDFSVWSRLAQLAVPLTLILFAESWGTMRALALRHGDNLSANRELGAIGLANFISALAHGMPVGAGFSAGSANETAGATTRLAAVVAALGVATIMLLAAPLVARIPAPVLAAVVIAALTHALAIAPLRRLFVVDRDQWIALAAALAVIIFGVLNGMLIAIALSIGALLHRLSQPRLSELGQLGSSHDFVDRAFHDNAHGIPGVAIFRPNAPLFFANAEKILGDIALACARQPAGTVIILSLEESDDFDSSALEALGEFNQHLASNAMPLHLARAHDRVRELLTATGMGTLARDATFSVADAVALVAGQPVERGDG